MQEQLRTVEGGCGVCFDFVPLWIGYNRIDRTYILKSHCIERYIYDQCDILALGLIR